MNLFSGRIKRLNFFLNFLGYVVISSILVMVITAILASSPIGIKVLSGLLIAVIYILGAIYGASLYIRRLHDIGQSGWLSLLVLVPVVNFGLLLFLLFKSGTTGSNKFGTAPAKMRYP